MQKHCAVVEMTPSSVFCKGHVCVIPISKHMFQFTASYEL